MKKKKDEKSSQSKWSKTKYFSRKIEREKGRNKEILFLINSLPFFGELMRQYVVITKNPDNIPLL